MTDTILNQFVIADELQKGRFTNVCSLDSMIRKYINT